MWRTAATAAGEKYSAASSLGEPGSPTSDTAAFSRLVTNKHAPEGSPADWTALANCDRIAVTNPAAICSSLRLARYHTVGLSDLDVAWRLVLPGVLRCSSISIGPVTLRMLGVIQEMSDRSRRTGVPIEKNEYAASQEHHGAKFENEH